MTVNASMVSAVSTPSGNKRKEWNWPNLGESTSIAAFLPFFPVQNKPSNHQINLRRGARSAHCAIGADFRNGAGHHSAAPGQSAASGEVGYRSQDGE